MNPKIKGQKHSVQMLSQIFIVTLLVFVMSGCGSQQGKLAKSAQKAFQSGNYDQAVRDAANALRIQPDMEQAQLALTNAFLPSVRRHEDNIRQLAGRKDLAALDQIVVELETLIELNTLVRDLPPLINKKNQQNMKPQVRDYTSELNRARSNAAGAHYAEGKRLAARGGLENNKAAAKEMKKTLGYLPDYRDAQSLYEEYRRGGIKRIAIVPFDNKSGKRDFGAIGEMVTDEIIASVLNDTRATEFLELISRTEMERVMEELKLGASGLVDETSAIEIGKFLGAHEILVGQITQIIADRPETVTKNEQAKKNVVIRKEKYKDENGKEKERKIRGDVTARVRKHKLVANAKIAGSFKIIDIKTTRLTKTDTFTGESSFSHEWATFTGDERALSYQVKKLTKEERKVAPSRDERVNEAAGQLAVSLAQKIKDYAR